MAKVSTKIVLAEKKDDGTAPVEIWINHKLKRRKKRLFWLPISDWDKRKNMVAKSHPFHIKLNNWIRIEVKKVQDRIFDLDMRGDEYTIEDIVSSKGTDEPTLYSLAIKMRDEKINLNHKVNPRLFQLLADKLQQFDPEATCQNVDRVFMDKFKAFLLSDPNINSPNTISRYMKRLKQILKAQHDAGKFFDMGAMSYPTKGARSNRKPLNIEELSIWRTVQLPEKHKLYRDFFMAMFYLRGARVGDVLQLTPKNIVGDRMIYKEQKTKKHQDQLVVPQLQNLIDRYEGQSPYYLFPIMRKRPSDPDIDTAYQKHIESCTAKLNLRYKHICEIAGITKKVTNHVARDTFTSMAKDAGLAVGVIQEMLNHSSETTTEIYITSLKMREQLDDAAKKVFTF